MDAKAKLEQKIKMIRDKGSRNAQLSLLKQLIDSLQKERNRLRFEVRVWGKGWDAKVRASWPELQEYQTYARRVEATGPDFREAKRVHELLKLAREAYHDAERGTDSDRSTVAHAVDRQV